MRNVQRQRRTRRARKNLDGIWFVVTIQRVMARNLHDQFGKNILHDLFRLRGIAQTEAEVPPGNAKRIDLWFVPDETLRCAEDPPLTGILAEIAADAAAIELWSKSMTIDDVHRTFSKREVWHETLRLRDKRRWPRPPLWHICAGKPVTVIEKLGFKSGKIPGWYVPPMPDWLVQLVCIGELPATRETILLRLLGRGTVRRNALRELEKLPASAWEKQLAQPWLMRVRFDVPPEVVSSAEDKEFVMDVHAWYAEHKRDLRAEFKRELVPEIKRELVPEIKRELEPELAVAQLRGEVKQIAHLFERRMGRPLTSAEREVLTTRMREQGSERVGDLVLDLSASDLSAWLQSAG
jgi:hypothetical protein